jgi:hypothetical protein
MSSSFPPLPESFRKEIRDVPAWRWAGGRNGGGTLWVEAGRLARGPGHPFYRKLAKLLDAEGFDAHVERLCAWFYADRGGVAVAAARRCTSGCF